MGKVNGQQSGDPYKGAQAMWEVAKMKDPPPRLVLGTPAYNVITGKLKADMERIEKHEKLTKSTDEDGFQAS